MTRQTKKFNKKDIDNVVTSMIDVFEKDFVNENKESVEAMVKLLETKNRVRAFESLTRKQKMSLDAALKSIGVKEAHKVADVLLNFSRYKDMVTRIVEKFEGMTCSVDKSSFVVKRWLNSISEGETMMDYGEDGKKKHYWVPTTIPADLFADLLEGVHLMKFGHVNDFLLAYQSIVFHATLAIKKNGGDDNE